MRNIGNCYLIRDLDPSAPVPPGEPAMVLYQHTSEGHGYARQWAASHSTGRPLVVVEVINGDETTNQLKFEGGRQA